MSQRILSTLFKGVFIASHFFIFISQSAADDCQDLEKIITATALGSSIADSGEGAESTAKRVAKKALGDQIAYVAADDPLLDCAKSKENEGKGCRNGNLTVGDITITAGTSEKPNPKTTKSGTFTSDSDAWKEAAKDIKQDPEDVGTQNEMPYYAEAEAEGSAEVKRSCLSNRGPKPDGLPQSFNLHKGRVN